MLVEMGNQPLFTSPASSPGEKDGENRVQKVSSVEIITCILHIYLTRVIISMEEVESKGIKRNECSSPPFSACQFSRKKQRKIPDILKGLGPTIDLDDDEIKPTLYGSSSDLPILVLDSCDQQQLSPKNDPSRTSVDTPIIIIDSDDTNSINRHQKDPSPKAALTGKYRVENQPKDADLPIIAVDSDVNSGIQEDFGHALIETSDQHPQTTLTTSDAEEVELSKEANESAYKRTSNSLQFYLIRVGGPRDVSGLKLGNTQNASSADAVDDSFARIDSEKENLPLNAPMNDDAATAVDDEITKSDNHQIDVKDNSLDASDGTSDERVCKKFKELRELNSPSNCSIQLQETVCSDMEDTSQVGVEDDLCEIWKEMEFGLECTKDCLTDHAAISEPVEEYTECDHSVILKDDLGYVCRVCGVIQQSIDTIFDFQFYKGKRSTRTQEPRNTNNTESTNAEPCVIPSNDFTVTEISAHVKHRKLMKPHQVEGFNFLCSNLITDSPGGCILAHAPGSGKTFMIISFIQSFLARYPDSRPLIVLPKGILQTWKNEFLKWQVEEIPLYDFYTSKAENRSQQLSVLKKWTVKKSVLFLGYKQLSVIICDSSTSEIASKCKDILQKVPSILILDEGHTPRNEETDLLRSLSSVRTPRKVVLSGTLYQNHVKEVFNILNLVRPKFLKLPNSKMIVNRIMSRVKIVSSGKKHLKCGLNSGFYESVEYTLQKDEDFKRRKAVIGDLREMTRNVLHYYKGDFLDELPGLVDYTVVLNLSPKQKDEVRMLRKLNLFKRTSLGSGIYVHPVLKSLSQVNSAMIDGKIDEVLDGLDVNEGVKTKFFLNMLGLCESSREKLLVFSQYIVPLKLLERLTAKVKGWRVGREVFMITGDTNVEERERCMEQFNGSEKARVFFRSIKACGEGISLVGASRVIIMDVHLNPSVTRQAIGRAFRPGQKKKVFTYRLIAGDSPEEEDSLTCCRKELIAKMWFEWNEYSATQDFEMKAVDPEESEDAFFQCPGLIQDLNVLYKR